MLLYRMLIQLLTAAATAPRALRVQGVAQAVDNDCTMTATMLWSCGDGGSRGGGRDRRGEDSGKSNRGGGGCGRRLLLLLLLLRLRMRVHLQVGDVCIIENDTLAYLLIMVTFGVAVTLTIL